MKSVELLDGVNSQQFVMISKAYSDGVSLRKDGPIRHKFCSECICDAGKSYRTEGTFIPKLVPKHFVTTLTVANEVTYYESIAFERRTVLQKFSETTNIFLPKEVKHNYYSELLFDPNAMKIARNYISGIELCPAQKCIVTKDFNDMEEGGTVECVKKAVNGNMNGCKELTNGEI